jgi:hypothetical protein
MWQIFLIWEKVVHWYCRVVLKSSSCFVAQELKEVETLITMKYATQIKNMQAQLFATTKELKESTITISHQQNIIEDLKQHMAIATNARLYVEETLQRS